MKKLIALVMVAIMIFAMAACGNTAKAPAAEAPKADAPAANTPAAEAPAEEKVEEPYIVMISPLLGNAIWDVAHNGFKQAIADFGWNGEVVGPTTVSPDEMANLLDIAIAEGADGIVTQGLMPAEAINRAVEQGIEVMLVQGDNSGASGTFAYLGKDIVKEAELFYEEACKYVGKDEKMVVSIQLSTLSDETTALAYQYIQDAFAKHPGGYELANTSIMNSDTTKALTEWENTFNTYSDINVCINYAAEGLSACVKAADEAGITILGVDDLESTLDCIKQGKAAGTTVVSFWNFGYQACVWMHEHLVEGRNPAVRESDAGTMMVNAENIDSFGDLMKEYTHLPE